MKKVSKGQYGYLAYCKKRTLTNTLVYAVICIAVYIVGLLLNHMSRQNIFTVIAVLGVLPMVKQMVGFVVVFPFHNLEKKVYDDAEQKLPEGMELMADLVITSSEKIMHLDLLTVGNHRVIAVLGDGKQDISYVREYLSNGIANWGTDYKVQIVERHKAFFQEMERISEIAPCTDEEQEELDNVKSYLRSLIV